MNELFTSLTINFVSFPSGRMFTKEWVGKCNISRTIVYHSDCIADILHITIDAVGERQELRRCHPNFFLCQVVEPFKRVLDISLSQ